MWLPGDEAVVDIVDNRRQDCCWESCWQKMRGQNRTGQGRTGQVLTREKKDDRSVVETVVSSRRESC